MDVTGMTQEEVYAIVSPTIDKWVLKFHNMLQWDVNYEDLRANANTSFIRCWHCMRGGHRGGHPNFMVGLRAWVWNCMFDDYRSENHTQRRKRPKQRVDIKTVVASTGFCLFEFVDSLPPDSRTIVQFVLAANDPTNPLAKHPIAKEATSKGGQGRNWRSTLRHRLASDYGWTPSRIKESFEAIKMALGTSVA